MPRLFFAIETPPPLKKELVAIQNKLADRLRALHPTPDFKPERLINSHCTIRFLGNVNEAKVDALSSSVSQALAEAHIPSFECALADCGVFSNPRQARVIWVGIQPEEPFQRIQQAVDPGLSAANIPVEAEHSFHPHLTLVRFREPYRLPNDFEFPSLTCASPTAVISEVRLIESKTLAGGAIHTVRASFALGR